MNLLTFLGTSDYKQTTYVLEEQRHTTCYCPAALVHFCRPETTLIVVTEAAEAKHFETLADEIASVTQPVAVPIPEGHSEANLWTIFEALTGEMTAQDELVVDITYGFRSLPFLSFLAIAFMRLARQVRVRKVYYGAWEARNEANESPVFDLTPFVTLLDWTIATDRFTRFGDASDLAGLLREGIPSGPLMGSDMEARQLGNALKKSAAAMEDVSLALRLTRPLETMIAGHYLMDTLEAVGPAVKQKARPFGLLADQMRRAYMPMALSDPRQPKNWPISLQIQLDLIGWYLDKGQVVQAVTLAREWLVSVLGYHFQGDFLTGRQPVENALNNEVERHRPNPRPPREPAFDAQLRALPQCKELGQVWNRLIDLRNDIAHVGMRVNAKGAEKLRQETQALYPRLQAIGQIFLENDQESAS